MRARAAKVLRGIVSCSLALPLAAALVACAPQAWEPPPGTMQSGWRGSTMVGVNMLVSGYEWDGGASGGVSDAAAPMDVDQDVPAFEVGGVEAVRVYFMQDASEVRAARYSVDVPEGEPVTFHEVTNEGATLEVEPGWRYAFSAQFEDGSADYLIDVVSDGSAQEGFTSTATVVVLGNGEPLFIDGQTESPYYPTLPADAPELATGNIVRVTGNGIMLESYPAQYPGITKVEVIEEGSPEDAEKYAELAAQLWQPKDPSEPAIATLEYRTDDAVVSMGPLASGFTWSYEQGGETVTVSNDAPAPTDYAATELADARVGGAAEATVSFDVEATGLEVTRWSEDDLSGPGTPVAVEGTTFTIEPGWRYAMRATFEQGEVTYVFTVM